MKFFQRISPAMILFLIVFLVISFFRIDGRQVRNINKLDGTCDVTVTVHKDDHEPLQHKLSPEQIVKLRELIRQNHYTRRLSNTIIGVLPDTDYSILADWNDNGQTHLYIRMIGGEYINFSDQFGGHYHKIKNPEFEKSLLEILNP